MITALITAFATWTSLFLIRRLLASAGLVDLPNARSSHTVPTIRGAGLATAPAIAIATIVAAPAGASGLAFALGTLALMVLGLLDDLRLGERGLSWRVRLGFQLSVAIWMCAIGIRVESVAFGSAGIFDLGVWSWPLSVLWIVGLTNAFNFMDGLNAMAALQATVIGVVGWLLVGPSSWGVIYLFIAAAALGFLPHNAPRARVFLGDTGSLPFGFAIAVATIAGSRTSARSQHEFLPLALLAGPIVVDTIATVLRRIAHRENIAEAHREHLYQRLNDAGLSHAQVSLGYVAMTLLCALCAALWRVVPAATLVAWPTLGLAYVLLRLHLMRRLNESAVRLG